MGTRKFRTPGSAQQSALEAAKTLMSERLKYEQWLDDLEAKKESTPAKVFERVQKDYLDRLQNVVAQLTKYTETLEQYAETLTGKLRDLEAMEEANEEEQAEQALRKQVGEISVSEWESSSRKAQKELAKIKENKDTIEADLEQIRSLLGETEEVEEEAEDGEEKPARKDFNELEFLSSVVGQSTSPIPAAKPAEPRTSNPTASPPPAAKAPTPPAAQPAAAAGSRASNPTSTPAVPATPAPPARTSGPATSPPAASAPTPLATPAVPPAAPAPAAPPVAAAPAAPATETPKPAAAPADSPSIIRTSGEQPKTLKCTECGSMNYPTEWYCERCGAELTGA